MYVKLGVGISGFLMGYDSSGALFAILLLCNKSFSETICRHGNLVVADLVDEDFVIHKRSQSMSSAVSKILTY
jgi:hypothetical protein